VAEPVRVNGVLIGMVKLLTGATTGGWLAVMTVVMGQVFPAMFDWIWAIEVS
jgi:hypothetical protein